MKDGPRPHNQSGLHRYDSLWSQIWRQPLSGMPQYCSDLTFSDQFPLLCGPEVSIMFGIPGEGVTEAMCQILCDQLTQVGPQAIETRSP